MLPAVSRPMETMRFQIRESSTEATTNKASILPLSTDETIELHRDHRLIRKKRRVSLE
jgi:hypothetical protein